MSPIIRTTGQENEYGTQSIDAVDAPGMKLYG